MGGCSTQLFWIKNKTTTVYFLITNADEVWSDATGLPLFIKDYFKLDLTFLYAPLERCSRQYLVNLTIKLEFNQLKKKLKRMKNLRI